MNAAVVGGETHPSIDMPTFAPRTAEVEADSLV